MLITRVPLLFFMAAAVGTCQVSNVLTITTRSTLVPAVLGLPYSQSLSATGGTPPYAWFIPSGTLPAGLALSTTGAITGILGTAGTFEVTIAVTDNASATATQTFSITVIPRPLTRFGSLSHIAAGGWWDTTITLINTSSVPIAVTALFRADDGTTLSLPLKLTQQGVSQSTTASSLIAAMNPNSSLVIATGALSNTVVGWVDLLSSGPVSGFAVMRSTPTNDKPSEATVPLQTAFPSSLTLPYDNTAGYVMGVALVNLELGSAVINAKVWDEDGAQIGVQQMPIPGSGHTSFVLTDKLALTAGKRGIIQFQNSSGGVSGLGLRFSPSGPFTNVPVMLQQ
jgi:hypothetical protein